MAMCAMSLVTSFTQGSNTSSHSTATATSHRPLIGSTLPQHALTRFFCSSTHCGRPPQSVSVNQGACMQDAGDRCIHQHLQMFLRCVLWWSPYFEFNAIFKLFTTFFFFFFKSFKLQLNLIALERLESQWLPSEFRMWCPKLVWKMKKDLERCCFFLSQ